MEEAAKSQAEYLNWIDAFENEAIEGIKAGGGEIKDFPADQLAAWKAKAPNLLNDWAEDMKSRGLGDEAATVQAKWTEWLGR